MLLSFAVHEGIHPENLADFRYFLIVHGFFNFLLDWWRYTVIVIYNSIGDKKVFIRIEPSSATPIYRQIIDQIRYQAAAGILRKGDRVPSVRELASRLAVNQNTILKVYNELCREGLFKIERGEGTFVAGEEQGLSGDQRRELVAGPLREAAVLAIQLGLSVEEAGEMLRREYREIVEQKNDQGGGKGAEHV